MKMIRIYRWFVLLLVTAMVSCEKNFDIVVKPNTPLLVVEGYINNIMPSYNYVLLTTSQDYYSPDITGAPVTGAVVSVTEGSMLPDHSFSWDATTKTILKESTAADAGFANLPGAYFDERLRTDSAHALIGNPGKFYLLEIDSKGKHYSSISFMPPTIMIDSLTSGYHYIDENDEDSDSALTKARVTIHYQDPDTIGNTLLFYSRSNDNRNNVGWGGLRNNRFITGTDDLTNGEYMHLTISSGFVIGEEVDYYMVSVERKIYNFWDSYRKARNNGGPFSTPVTLLTTMEGENVTGCFSAFSISTKSITMQ
ncbi:MAG: hypothetical protein QM802_26125 [Agriterribacter sp.]